MVEVTINLIKANYSSTNTGEDLLSVKFPVLRNDRFLKFKREIEYQFKMLIQILSTVNDIESVDQS